MVNWSTSDSYIKCQGLPLWVYDFMSVLKLPFPIRVDSLQVGQVHPNIAGSCK